MHQARSEDTGAGEIDKSLALEPEAHAGSRRCQVLDHSQSTWVGEEHGEWEEK